MMRLGVRASAWAYRLLLRLRYPAALRRRYGADMRALFETMAREAWDDAGWAGLARIWMRVLGDAVRPVPGPVGAATSADRGVHTDDGRGVMGRQGSGGRMAEDLGFAWRSLTREMRFSGLVTGVLAVGIALNLGVFAVVNAYLLRSLPYPDAERLVSVRAWGAVSWSEADDVFERAVSWDLDVFTLVGDGKPVLTRGAWITPDFLDAYGIRAQLGRTFRRDEAGAGGASVAMISHGLWQGHFGGRADILGTTFRAFMSDRPEEAEVFTIVGVLPSDFWHLNEYTEVLAPIRADRAIYAGRLRPDVPVERAEEILTRIALSNLEEVPADFRVDVVPMQESYVEQVRPTLYAIQSAVLLVLLIACANAAVLLLVRSARRERELGVRRALGASGGRLARQLFAEGMLLAGTAGALGVLLAGVGLDLAEGGLEARLGTRIPGGTDALTLDGTVMLAAVGLSALVGALFGLVPLLMTRGGGLAGILGEAARGGSDSRARQRLRSAMVAGEVALSLTLLIGAGLMVRSAMHLQSRELGFESERLVRHSFGVRAASYPETDDRNAVFDRLLAEVRALPEVESAALTASTPFASQFNPQPLEGRTAGSAAVTEAASWLTGEGYFETAGITLLRGRDFTPEDGPGTERVAIVSDRLARDLWGTDDVLGRELRTLPAEMPGMGPAEPGPWVRVVGVAADVQREVSGAPGRDVYAPYRQFGPLWLDLLVRERAGAAPSLAGVERVFRGVDSEVPVYGTTALAEAVATARAPTRYLARLLTGFSTFALLLSVLGLYGVVSYAVRQRRRDIAIRVALGADRPSVTRLFVLRGLVTVAIGIALGLGGGHRLGRLLEPQLHGVAAADLPTYAALALVLAASAVAAVWIPSRRAAAADPMGVLREE